MGKFTVRNLYRKSASPSRRSLAPSNLATAPDDIDVRQSLSDMEVRQLLKDPYPLAPSDTGPRTTKSKSFLSFTFRRKSRRIDITEPATTVGQGITSEIFDDPSYAPRFDPRNPNMATSVFLGRSTPPWETNRGRSLLSDVFLPVDSYSTSSTESRSTSTPSTDTRDLAELLSKLGRPSSSDDTSSLSLFSAEGDTQFTLRQSVDWQNQGTTLPGLTTLETRISGIVLPAPPIIISAPTPPNFGRVESSEVQLEQLESYRGPSTNRNGLCRMLEVIQKVARQLEHDPAFSMDNIYRFTAPVFVFLYGLTMAIILPRKQSLIICKLGVDEEQPILAFFLLTLLGVPFLLMIWKAILWLMGEVYHLLCTIDIQAAFGTGVCFDSTGDQATDVDLIVGNLFGTRNAVN